MEKSIIIHGKDLTEQKKKALHVLETLDIPTTILCVCIKGVNENDVRYIVSRYIIKGFVKSITIQNMTYTGKNGENFKPREHITIDEVENLLSENNVFSSVDFFSLGAYHPLCYSAAYYIVYNDRMLPLTRLIDGDKLSKYSENSYFLSPDGEFSQSFLDGINNLWAEGNEEEEFINVLKSFFKRVYPADEKISQAERRRRAEEMIKMVYIHSHMDKYNFDIGRVSHCGDLVPDEDGKMIPACSYNLFYRQKDERFWQDHK
jgi:7,8-dihydro-6-hydroxymethylpterin dimethyltransferase